MVSETIAGQCVEARIREDHFVGARSGRIAGERRLGVQLERILDGRQACRERPRQARIVMPRRP